MTGASCSGYASSLAGGNTPTRPTPAIWAHFLPRLGKNNNQSNDCSWSRSGQKTTTTGAASFEGGGRMWGSRTSQEEEEEEGERYNNSERGGGGGGGCGRCLTLRLILSSSPPPPPPSIIIDHGGRAPLLSRLHPPSRCNASRLSFVMALGIVRHHPP